MRLSDLTKLTHTHKIELLLLAFVCLFNLSFGLEKLADWLSIKISPLYYAVWYLSLGFATSVFTLWDLIVDVKEDCNCKEDQ